jgi:hypothetical protein
MDSRELSELIASRQSELGELSQPPVVGHYSGEPDFDNGQFTVTFYSENAPTRVAVLSNEELASSGWFDLVLGRLGRPSQNS